MPPRGDLSGGNSAMIRQEGCVEFPFVYFEKIRVFKAGKKEP